MHRRDVRDGDRRGPAGLGRSGPRRHHEVVLLSDLGLSIDQEALPAAAEDLAACGDLVTVMLASSSATAEQTSCATDILSNEIAAELLLIQVSGLEPSAELVAANEALNDCTTPTTTG